MASTFTYTLSLMDKMSAPLKMVSTTSMHVIEKLGQMGVSQKKFQAINADLGGSIASLRARLEMLRAEREIISPANFKDIKRYNIEIGKLEDKISKLDNLGRKGVSLELFNTTVIIQQVQSVSDAFSGLSQIGIGFEQGVADLSAITGIAGEELKYLSDVARKTGRDSGLGAAQGVEAFKLLASQIDVSKIGIEGLTELQRRSITLAQASGMTMADSANALAGTINQFGLQAEEANRVINVLAAGSKYGAAEIPELAQSFKVVGAAANAAGLSVEDTAGAVEVLSKNNLKGAEAGTALRNIVLKMQTALGYDFRNTSLTQALDDLKPKLTDATYLSKIFGMENIAAAQFLISNSSSVAEMTARVTDSNVAQEQAAIRTSTTQAMMERCRATVDNLKIGIFETTGSFGGYITVIGEQAVVVSQLIPLLSVFGTTISWITKLENIKKVATFASTAAAVVATGVQWLLNGALYACPIVWIIAAIIALVAIIVYLCSKITGWGSLWDGIVGFMKWTFTAFADSVKLIFTTVVNGIMIGIDMIKLGWYNFKEAIGMGDSSENQSAIAKINADVEQRQKAIVDGAKKVVESGKKANEALSKIDMGWDSEKSLGDVTGGLKKSLGMDDAPTVEAPAKGSSSGSLSGLGSGGLGGGEIAGAGASSLDLNKIPTSLKGSTAYTAITSKLRRVVIPTMAAATIATASLPPISEASLPPTREVTTEQQQQLGTTAEADIKSVTIENITINIASASAKDIEYISEAIRMEMLKILS